MKLFRPISPDALHNLRVLLEKADMPNVQALAQAAELINKTEAYRDAIAKGLVVQVTSSDLGDFYNRYRERYQVDASRRTADKNAKKSALRADQAEDVLPDDVALSDEFQSFMRGRTAWQNNGVALVSLGDVVAQCGGDFERWLLTERTAVIVAPETQQRAAVLVDRAHALAEAA